MTRRVSDNIINSSFFSLKGCCPTTKSFFNHVYHYMTNLREQLTGEKMQYDFKKNTMWPKRIILYQKILNMQVRKKLNTTKNICLY